MMRKKLKGLLLVGIIFSCIAACIVIAVPEYDQEVLDAFENQTEVDIIVKLYRPNITKMNLVLATISEQEFKLKGKSLIGRSFNGEISKKGFDILINNSYIKIIHLDKISHIAKNGLEIDNETERTKEEILVKEEHYEEDSEDFSKETLDEEKKKEKSWFRKCIRFLKSLFIFK